MQTLKQQIISAHGEKGKQWLNQLLEITTECAKRWHLKDLVPFSNLSWNYVAKGIQNTRAIVVKISCDLPALEREVMALKSLTEGSCVKAIEYEPSLGAVLLEALEPGEELLSQTFDSQQMVTICCEVAKKIKQSQIPTEYPFQKIRDQLSNIDKDWPQIPSPLLQTARELKTELLPQMLETHIIHGDLHRQNILSHGASWKAIDPKGYLGSLYNEVWPFIHEPQTEIPLAARALQLNKELLTKWCFVHSILSTTWCCEDGVDPKNILALAKKIFKYLRYIPHPYD